MQPSSDVRVGSAASYTKAGANDQTFDAALRRGQTRKRCAKGLWSALQTYLQGVDGAMPAIVPEKCRHRAALPISIRYRAKNSRALKGRQVRVSSKSNRESPRGHACHRFSGPCARCSAARFREIRRWRACARFRRRWRRCGQPAWRSARSAAACRGNSPAPRRSPRPRGS